jgi:hypothetical protein
LRRTKNAHRARHEGLDDQEPGEPGDRPAVVVAEEWLEHHQRQPEHAEPSETGPRSLAEEDVPWSRSRTGPPGLPFTSTGEVVPSFRTGNRIR